LDSSDNGNAEFSDEMTFAVNVETRKDEAGGKSA
jgi:hypothetical protein